MKQIFPAVRAGESPLLTFDFTSALGFNDTVSSGTVTASLYSGSDTAASGIVSGSAVVSSPLVTQQISNLQLGNIYSLICKGILSDGSVREIQGFLSVGQDAV